MKKVNTILIHTKSSYLSSQSDSDKQRFTWAYEVFIKNTGEEIVQLLNRYWKITDMSSKVEEIEGPGVIGLQPIIKPGREFIYNSFCQLSTPQGTMEGHYEMQNLDEQHFVVEIPKFILTAPDSLTRAYRSKLH
jgi:ApaG protein